MVEVSKLWHQLVWIINSNEKGKKWIKYLKFCASLKIEGEFINEPDQKSYKWVCWPV